jgi:glycosyltransferase involved in cell wall biosynthesis
MSVYNGERYLREAVESILNQTFSDFEFIIVDDGSRDKTWQILREYAAQDSRIVLVRNSENLELTKSLNKGLHVARGEYIARQDADDVSLPFRFEKQVGALDRQSEVVLVSGDLDLIDENGQVWHRPRRNANPGLVAWFLLFYNYLGGHSQVMFRRQCVVDLGGYSEERPYSQDYELWLRLAEIGKIVIVPEVVLSHRRHKTSVSSNHSAAQWEYSLIDSQYAIARLLGEELSLEDVANLRAFWLSPLPDICAAASLNRRLKGLYWAYLRKQAYSGSVERNLAVKLSQLVGRRFLSWAQVMGLKRRPISTLKVLGYALHWYLSASLVTISRDWSQ